MVFEISFETSDPEVSIAVGSLVTVSARREHLILLDR